MTKEYAVRKVRVNGLVKLAESVRRDLATPQPPGALDDLAAFLADQLSAIDEILAQRRCGIEALPKPSRTAYVYLAGLDVRKAKPSKSNGAGIRPSVGASIPGIRSVLNALLDHLAACRDDARAAALHEKIKEIVADASQSMRASSVAASQLTAESRSTLTWLRILRERTRFKMYLLAIRRATAALESAIERQGLFRLPVVVHFRPIRALYRAREHRSETRVHLAAPMITFDADGFRALAGMLCGQGSHREEVLGRTREQDYQKLHHLLDGTRRQSRCSAGAFHDLIASFDRVNVRYFDGKMQRPKLSWSERVTNRRFGYYNFAGDEVVLSSSMDSPNVSQCAVDFVVYHELLHKKHGVQWKSGRQCAHTSAFRREERLFRDFSKAQAEMNRLACRLSGHPART